MKMAIITITVYANSATEAENRNASNDEQSSNSNRVSGLTLHICSVSVIVLNAFCVQWCEHYEIVRSFLFVKARDHFPT